MKEIRKILKRDKNLLKNWLLTYSIKITRDYCIDPHVDEIGGILEKKRRIPRGLYLLNVGYIVNEELTVPWNYALIIWLRSNKERKGGDFNNISNITKELGELSSPSLYWSGRDIFSSFENNCSNVFSKNIEVRFSEYRHSEGFFCRDLTLALSRKNVFKVILSEIFNKRIFKLNLNTLEDKISLNRIEKLKLELKKDPGNINLVVELAVLTFLVSNLEEALVYLDSFKKKYPNNGEVYFWKAILTYYCNCQVAQKTHCKHLKEAKNLLANGIKVEPNNPKCLSFLFRLVWRETKSFEKAIKYMKKVKKIAPDWITPRIQLARYYLYEFDELDRKEALELLKKELEELSLVNWKKFGGKKNFREKYLTAYFTGKTKENRTVVLELMRWHYGIKRFRIKNISKEDKKFLKRAGLKYKILDE